MFSGAEAIVSEVSFAGREMLIKKRIVKNYRQETLDNKLRVSRNKREVRLLNFAKKCGIKCPLVYYVGEDYFLMEKVSGRLLRDCSVNNESLIKKIGELAAKMHSNGIVHGDFTPANIIVSNGEPVVIDFGLGAFSDEIEDKSIDLLLMKRSLPSGFDVLVSSYLKSYKSKIGNQVVTHITDVEKRARYVQR